MATKAIPFFTDQNVPDSIGNYLVSLGHGLTRLRDVMPTDTKDPVIAIACSENAQVLVTFDTDFKAAAKRLKLTKKKYQNSLHRVLMRCHEPDGVARLKEAIAIIESEWKGIKKGRPMCVEVHAQSIRLIR